MWRPEWRGGSRMKPFRNSSITARLTAMHLLVCLFALVVACAGVITYDVASIRESIVATVRSQAQIVAQSSSAPLVFNDPDTAQRMLYSLRASPNISGALITGTDHLPFARYGEEIEVPQGLRAADLPEMRSDISSNHLVVAAPIRAGDQMVGTLYVVSELTEMNTRVRRYLLIAVGVLVLSVLGGLLVSIRIRKSIADPIVHLAETADSVTRVKNFDVRAESTSEAAELSVLVDSFNKMLVEISQRDKALRELAHESQVTLQSIPQLVFTADAKGEVLFLSDRWYDYTGLGRDEEKSTWASHLHPDDRELATLAWRRAVMSGSRYG